MFEWILKRLKKDNRGFTLIELVVVIAILGILAGIAIPKLRTSRKNAAIAAHNANVRTLESAATMYMAEEGVPGDDIDDWKGENVWEDYLQEWPEIPGGLVGETPKGDEAEEIEEGDEYEVKISKEGDIKVTPGKVSTED